MDSTAIESKESRGSGASGVASLELLWGGVRVELLLVAGLAVLIVTWLVLNFAFEQAGILVLSQWTQYSVVTINKLDSALGALLLFLLAADREKMRLRSEAALDRDQGTDSAARRVPRHSYAPSRPESGELSST